jgi:hypothetical protein
MNYKLKNINEKNLRLFALFISAMLQTQRPNSYFIIKTLPSL